MTTTPEVLPIPMIGEQWRADPPRLAVAGFLARYRGETRRHAESDLRACPTWCQERDLDPLTARRPHIELHVRWMQETRRYAASTVSRRMSIVGGFYRTCVSDELPEHSPAVARSVDRAVADRTDGPLLLNTVGRRLDRHAATRRLRRLAAAAGVHLPRMHPHMLRHTYVTTMLDAGVDLRDVPIAARHADPRTTMRYDRARTTLDRHPTYILAAYMASGT